MLEAEEFARSVLHHFGMRVEYENGAGGSGTRQILLATILNQNQIRNESAGDLLHQF